MSDDLFEEIVGDVDSLAGTISDALEDLDCAVICQNMGDLRDNLLEAESNLANAMKTLRDMIRKSK